MPPSPNKPCDMMSCRILSSRDKNVTRYKMQKYYGGIMWFMVNMYKSGVTTDNSLVSVDPSDGICLHLGLSNE